uniref:Uncharacterized protein n=1 Tax=Spironucleus salmonicida TaxID=348837 RepID=V6M6Q1_9EUKA|eukprot:EST49099.1 Hypothetical protein SS50377_10633 [Spironucleus salmonicida]
MLSQNYVIPASDREEPCEYALQMVSQNSIKQEYQSNQSWMQSRWHSALIWNYWLYLKSNIVQTSQFSQISSQTLHIQYKIQNLHATYQGIAFVQKQQFNDSTPFIPSCSPQSGRRRWFQLPDYPISVSYCTGQYLFGQNKQSKCDTGWWIPHP